MPEYNNNFQTNKEKVNVGKSILIGIGISLALFALFWIGKLYIFPTKIEKHFICRNMGIEYKYTIKYNESNDKIDKIEAEEEIKNKINIEEKITASAMIEKINQTFKDIGGLCQEQQ